MALIHTPRVSQSASNYYPWSLGLKSFLKPSAVEEHIVH